MQTPALKTENKASKTAQPHQSSGKGQNMPFFQAKLTVNQPGDQYEQEADQVADQVMRMPDPVQRHVEKNGTATGEVQRQIVTPLAKNQAQASPLGQAIATTPSFPNLIQAKCAECAQKEKQQEEESLPGASPIMRATRIHHINGTGIVPVQRACAKCAHEEEVKRKEKQPEINGTQPIQVQRACADCDQDDTLMRQESSSDSGGQTAPDVVSNVLSSGAGRPMDGSTREFMESRFGQDFGQVRIHTDGKAAESAAAINARAYTSGSNVVFGKGEYQPDSEGGKRLLAHELVHVGQQEDQSKQLVLQRSFLGGILGAGIGLLTGGLLGAGIGFLAGGVGGAIIGGVVGGVLGAAIGAGVGHSQTTERPWAGIVSDSNLADLWQDEQRQNKITTLSTGTRLHVLRRSGELLQVRVFVQNIQYTGYVHSRAIRAATSDSTASEMESMLGQQMSWHSSGSAADTRGRKATDFAEWAAAVSESQAPPLASSTVINCWEVVLLAAYRAGAISWSYIHDLYVNQPSANWPDLMSRGRRISYREGGPNSQMPQRGDIVFFNGLAHVALATGNGSDVLTFWPPPDTPFLVNQFGGVTDRVKIFTIEALATWWHNKHGQDRRFDDLTSIEFGRPVWSD